MSNKIILDNRENSHSGNSSPLANANADKAVKPNLFLGRTDTDVDKSKFPDWDILPPNQFINPRIKK